MQPTSKLWNLARELPLPAVSSPRRTDAPPPLQHGFSLVALGLALIVIAFTTIMLLAITSRSYSNPELESFFTQGDGWGGIVIGETTHEEALALLQAHPWVGDISEFVPGSVVTWWWNGQQPALFDDTNSTFEGRLHSQDGVVVAMLFALNTSLADAQLTLGMPEHIHHQSSGEAGWMGVSRRMFYEQYNLTVMHARPISCPISLARYWNGPTIALFDARVSTGGLSGEPMPAWVFNPVCTH